VPGTLTERIISEHLVDESEEELELRVDQILLEDATGTMACLQFELLGLERVQVPTVSYVDHNVLQFDNKNPEDHAYLRSWAARYGALYSRPGNGISHYLHLERFARPGGFLLGADSHTTMAGALGMLAIGAGATEVAVAMAGWPYVVERPRIAGVELRGRLRPWVQSKDVVLELLRRWGTAQAQGMSVEFVDSGRALPMTYRNTIANMMAEAEAQNGIFAQDATTEAWFKERGIELPYPRLVSGAAARFEIDESMRLDEIVPMIAKPFSPGNAFPAAEVARERLAFDKALVGSCTNGSYDDLLGAALVLRAARSAGIERVAAGISFVVFPGSGAVGRQIELPEQRLGGASIAEIFRSAGAALRQSWCGPCFGQGSDALRPGERAITSFNRNWQNRMGVGGQGYLASPAVVAASALAGYMAPPSELGIAWNPEIFGV